MHVFRAFRQLPSALLTPALACLLCACADKHSRIVDAESPPAVSPGALNSPGPSGGLPSPAELPQSGRPAGSPRGTSLSEAGLLRNAAQFSLALSLNVTAQDDSAVFDPAFDGIDDSLGDLALGYYSFDASGYDREDAILLRWDSAPEDGRNLWIGLANWGANRWDWFQPASKLQLNLDAQHPIANYISGSGAVNLTVVLTGDAPASLNAIRIGKPLVSMVILAKHWTTFTPTSLDFQGGADIATGQIAHYEWDLDGDGDYEYDGGDQPYALGMPFSDPGEIDVGLRGTTDWNTTATTSHRLVLLAGNWETRLITDTVNDVDHATFVRSPALLPAGPAAEVPVVTFAQTHWDYTQGEPIGVPSIQVVTASDALGGAWAPASLQITNPAETNYPFWVDDIARLSGGQPAVIYRDSPSLSDAIWYLHATDATAQSWTNPEALSPETISGAGGTLEVFNGDLFCAYTSGGGLYVRRNAGTLNAMWDAPVTIEDPPGLFTKLARPALGQADVGPADPHMYCACQTMLAGNLRASAYIGDPDGSAPWNHALELFQTDSASDAGICMQSGTYTDPDNDQLRLVYTYIDDAYDTVAGNTSLRWAQNVPGSTFSTEPSIISDNSLVYTSQSLAGGIDSADHLSDLWLAYSIEGGGLRAYYYLQDNGWIALPDIEAADGTGLGGEPSCAWFDGHPAVAYVDTVAQEIKLAVLH